MNVNIINNYSQCPLKVKYEFTNQKTTNNFYDLFLKICNQIITSYFISFKPSEKLFTANKLYTRFDKYIKQLQASPEIIQAYQKCFRVLIKILDSHCVKDQGTIIGPTLFNKEYTIGEEVSFEVNGISRKIDKTTNKTYYDFYILYPFLINIKETYYKSLILNLMRQIIISESVFDKEDIKRSRFIIVDPFTPKFTAIYLAKLKLDVRFEFVEQILAGVSLKLFYPRPNFETCSNCSYKNICNYKYD